MGRGDAPDAVRLEGVPARLFVESQNHQHDLLRELALIDLGQRFDLVEQPPTRRVADLIAAIHHEYADVRSSTREQALDALGRGQDTVDLVVPVRAGMAAALRRWLQLVDDADVLCGEGALLTLAASPEVRRLRRWYVHTLVACLEGDRGERVAVYPSTEGPTGAGAATG